MEKLAILICIVLDFIFITSVGYVALERKFGNKFLQKLLRFFLSLPCGAVYASLTYYLNFGDINIGTFIPKALALTPPVLILVFMVLQFITKDEDK